MIKGSGAAMNAQHKRWVGQVINQEFQLREYLGGSESSAVFLSERAERKSQGAHKVAIKLLPANRTTSERQLSRWNKVSKLFHPHLLRLFESGRCRVDRSDLIYVVMEYAEENLSQIIPSRPLTPAETRDMLIPTLDALAYLHAKGLIHGHIKPANIMAVNDQLKLSTDGLSSTREPADRPPQKSSIYNPPEASAGTLSPASDVWALGITLVEVLTQRPPAAQSNLQAPPGVPETVPAPFLEIARHCLVTDPNRRWTITEIAAHLNPAASESRLLPSTPLAAVAPPPTPSRAASPIPLSARPGSPTVPRPSAFPPRPPASSAHARASGARARKRLGGHRYLIPALAVVVVLIAILGGARLLNRRETQPGSPSAARSPSEPSHFSQSSKDVPLSSHPTEESGKQLAGSRLSSETQQRAKQPPPQRKSQPALDASSVAASAPRLGARDASRGVRSDAAARASSGSGVPGEVLQQDVPNVSQKARASIQGKVRVSVKVHVDQSGNVTGAEFVSAGSSKYFADLAMRSAQKWEFAPAKLNGQYVATDWVLRYEFGNSGTKVFPQQAPR